MKFKNEISFIICGAWNTLFGYIFGVISYEKLSGLINFFLLGILVNVICISMAFFTYKIFVFKTKGKWLQEYMKSYIVYSFSAVVGTIGLWILYKKFEIPIWISQAFIIVTLTGISYIGHKKYTFTR